MHCRHLVNFCIFGYFLTGWPSPTKPLNPRRFWIFCIYCIFCCPPGWSAPLGTEGASIDCILLEVWAVSAVCDLRTMDVLDTHFIGVFEVCAVPAVCAGPQASSMVVAPIPSG